MLSLSGMRAQVGHTERFDATLMLLIDAMGFTNALAGCGPGAHGPTPGYAAHGNPLSAEYQSALRITAQLSGWYERRLTRFDEMISQKGRTFAARLAQLQQARRGATT